ncbi:MAG: hypothetical protein R2794_08095 [Chitinophagales bacterium]
MAGEFQAGKYIDRKDYPFRLTGSLFVLTTTIVFIVYISTGNGITMYTVFGTELFLLLLLNAFSCLLVKRFGFYIKRMVLAYILNTTLLFLLHYILLDKGPAAYKNIYPTLQALIFCFFSSLMLLFFLRTIVDYLKKE